jgi:hypothetical protein
VAQIVAQQAPGVAWLRGAPQARLKKIGYSRAGIEHAAAAVSELVDRLIQSPFHVSHSQPSLGQVVQFQAQCHQRTDRGDELLDPDGLGDVAVHPGLDAALPVTVMEFAVIATIQGRISASCARQYEASDHPQAGAEWRRST